MTPNTAPSDPQLARFRGYLRLLAEAHLDPRQAAKMDASDIVQQTLLEAHAAWPQFTGGSDAQLAQWLKQMLAHNVADAIRGLRRQKRDVQREYSLEAAVDDSFVRAESWLAAQQTTPSQHAVRGEQFLRLSNALDRLPVPQRQAIIGHHLRGLSLAELAESMDRSRRAVAGLLYRGLQQLREQLHCQE